MRRPADVQHVGLCMAGEPDACCTFLWHGGVQISVMNDVTGGVELGVAHARQQYSQLTSYCIGVAA